MNYWQVPFTALSLSLCQAWVNSSVRMDSPDFSRLWHSLKWWPWYTQYMNESLEDKSFNNEEKRKRAKIHWSWMYWEKYCMAKYISIWKQSKIISNYRSRILNEQNIYLFEIILALGEKRHNSNENSINFMLRTVKNIQANLIINTCPGPIDQQLILQPMDNGQSKPNKR